MPLIFLILAVPIIELLVLIEIGSVLGGLPTLALCFLTAAIGIALVRMQGLAVLAEAQRAAQAGDPPLGAVFHGVCLLVAGLFLLIPGFLTDLVGGLLLIPPLRLVLGRAVWGGVAHGGSVVTVVERGRRHGPAGQKPPSEVIEGSYTRVDDTKDRPDGTPGAS